MHPVRKKEPTSVELIKDIVCKYGRPDATLKDLRLAVMCLLSFAGLFRSKELLNIRIRDIKWFDDHFIIDVPESRTDVYTGKDRTSFSPDQMRNHALAYYFNDTSTRRTFYLVTVTLIYLGT